MRKARAGPKACTTSVFVLVAFGAVGLTTPQSSSVSPAPEPHLATIKQYCGGCHNDRLKAAGVSYDGLTTESIGQRADVFEKAVRKLRGRLMPPPGSRQPDQTDVDGLVTWLETKLDAAARAPAAA
jgi:mono/diheme cytochrome c family protein